MLITKADGTKEPFEPDKLKNSLKRAGASTDEMNTIVGKIERSLREGDSTQKIYRKAFDMLQRGGTVTAAKYSLRRALFDLGPTGFPFEAFLARVFEAEGYTVTVGGTVNGKCAMHEIDLAGYKDDHSFVAEAKFHARPGIKSDLQVALYCYARYLDLESYSVCPEDTCGIRSLYLITNTKFTSAVEKYAKCTGLELISWGLEGEYSLQHRIERAKLYPVTVLSHLSRGQKERLLDKNVVLCRDILKNPDVLKRAGVRGKKAQAVYEEARQLCESE